MEDFWPPFGIVILNQKVNRRNEFSGVGPKDDETELKEKV